MTQYRCIVTDASAGKPLAEVPLAVDYHSGTTRETVTRALTQGDLPGDES